MTKREYNRIKNAVTLTNGDILVHTRNAERACAEHIEDARIPLCREIKKMLIEETSTEHWPETSQAEKALIFASVANYLREGISVSDEKGRTRQ